MYKRQTEEETEVVPNLMIGFGIDEVQADYVAEIKLRHLNREYIDVYKRQTHGGVVWYQMRLKF